MALLRFVLRYRLVLLLLLLGATLRWTGRWEDRFRPWLGSLLDVVLGVVLEEWFAWSLGLVVLVGLVVRLLLEAQRLRVVLGLVLLLAMGGVLGAWLLAPEWLIDRAQSLLPRWIAERAELLLPQWIAERAPWLTSEWTTRSALVLVGLLLVAARRFGAVWIISSLVAAAAIAAWGIQGARSDDYFALITAGVALPILVVYFFFKWTAPLEPQRQAEVHTRAAASKKLDFDTEPAQEHAERFWPYAVLAQAAYLDKKEAEPYVEEQYRQAEPRRPSGAGCGQVAPTRQQPDKGTPWRLLHERQRSQGTEARAVKGLHYRIWFDEQHGTFAVVFRGTRFNRPTDWNANLHWVLGLRDHYTDIETFIAGSISKEVERHAEKKGLSNYTLVCAGHSLGGGLARQLAFCYRGQKCQKIQVYGFDSSAVDGRAWLRKPHWDRLKADLTADPHRLRISEVYERGEVLSALRIVLSYLPRPEFLEKLRQRTTYYRFNYSVSANVLQSHNMEELAAALKAIAGASEPADVEPAAARLQLQLIYDYIKFHIAMYMATPALLMVFGYGFGVEHDKPFLVGLVMMVLIFALAGMHASYFMGTHVNRQWQTDHLEEFQRSAFSTRRRFMHHWMYWAGLLAGVGGFLLSLVPSTAAAPWRWPL